MPRTLAILLIYILFFGGMVMGFIKEHQSLLNSYKRLMNNFPSLQRCTIRGWMALRRQTANFPSVHFMGETKMARLLNKVMSTARGVNSLLIIFLIPFIYFTY